VALATHKYASVALGVGATLRHLQERTLKPYLVLYMLLSGLPGVIIGANIVVSFNDQFLYISLGFLTLMIAIYSSKTIDLGIHSINIKLNSLKIFFGGLVLFLLGILNGSFSSGSGLLVTTWLVSWFRLSYSQAIAYTLIIVGFFWNGTGAIALNRNNPVQWSWLSALIIGSLIGGYLGSHFSIKKGNTLVKKSFEIISLLMGISLILRGVSYIYSY
tara:strand:- start:7439 stop:8089 length:651 start_codon:yes stop_codon:yes gene_type:complete